MGMILGIDPGKDKFGWAFVSSDGALVASGVIPSALAEGMVDLLLEGKLESLSSYTMEMPAGPVRPGSPETVLLGNGTAREGFCGILASRQCAFALVDEAYTTLEARTLYWILHPPRGFARLLPRGLRVPPRPIDDLAAWALVRRFLSLGVAKEA